MLAARETLVITYTGANEHSGASRPPAVPLGEILDALDRTTSAPVREQVLVRHPLQPYDARNFERGRLAGVRSFSFDRAALAGANAAAGPRSPRPPFLTGPLKERDVEDVSLADLKAFLAHPARAFLRHRLDVSTPLEADEVERRDPDRPRRARAVGRRRPAAARGDGRPGPDRGDDRRAAARLAAARRASAPARSRP